MMSRMRLKIGTRGSKLALTQSEWVREKIIDRYPDIEIDLVRIKTKGDKILDSPLSLIGGKGLFVKEIEDALLRGDVDIAVHSMKDVPAELPKGLMLAAHPKREDPRDAMISLQFSDLDDLPQNASVGTGSLRRSSQLLNRRPDLKIIPMRGNVDTRLKKLQTDRLDALILATAGLNRLGLSEKISLSIPTHDLLPAIGQGTLGLEIRENDTKTMEVIQCLNHRETALITKAERAFLTKLGGGCQVPIAGHGTLVEDTLVLRGMVAELDGSRILRDEIRGPSDQAQGLGERLGERILNAGADQILAAIYG